MTPQSNPVDIEAIRHATTRWVDGYIDIKAMEPMFKSLPVLYDEVEYLRSVVARIQANNIKMQDAIELYEARVKELEAMKTEVEQLRARVLKAEKDREQFFHKLVRIKIESGDAIMNAKRNRFDNGAKWLALKIQKIIKELAEPTKGESQV
jgi:hypothetical protein